MNFSSILIHLQRKEVKIALIAIAIIIIFIIVFSMLGSGNKQTTNTINSQEQASQNSEETKIAFSELIYSLYFPKSFKDNSSLYTYTPSDSVLVNYVDINSKKVALESTFVEYANKKVTMTITYTDFFETENSKTEAIEILGVNEDVASIVIVTIVSTGKPSMIVFLTVNGNIYYLNESALNKKVYTAKKIPDLTEVYSIKKVNQLRDNALDSTTAVIASKFDGSYVDINEYIYNL